MEISELKARLTQGYEIPQKDGVPQNSSIDGLLQDKVPALKDIQTLSTMLSEMLLSHGLKASKENISMLRSMMENGIPLTKENIQKMNQALKLTSETENALFLLKNNIKLTQGNAYQLDRLNSGDFKLKDQLTNLLNLIEAHPDKALVNTLKNTLVMPQPNQSAPQANISQLNQPPTQNPVPLQNAAQLNQTLPAPQTTIQQPDSVQLNNPTNQTQPMVNTPPQTVVVTDTAPTPPNPQNQASVLQTQVPAPQVPVNSQQAPTPVLPASPTPEPNVTQPPSTNSLQFTQEVTPTQTIPQTITQNTPQPASEATQLSQPTAPEPASVTPRDLSFNLLGSTPKDLDEFVSNLRTLMNEIEQTIGSRADTNSTNILSQSRAIESHIDFTNQIRNQIYVQVPVVVSESESNAELYIFKDKDNKKSSRSDTSTALIALDTLGLGHTETYMQKKAAAIHCQFNLESDRIVKLVRDNIHRLENLLQESGYSLSSFSFRVDNARHKVTEDPNKSNYSFVNDEVKHVNEMA